MIADAPTGTTPGFRRTWGEVSGIEGKVALVFGTSNGIGSAVALGLAEAGARVSCVDVNLSVADEAAAAIRTLGGEAQAFACDVTRRDEVRSVVKATLSKFGAIDRVVDVVGASPLTPVVDGDDGAWDLAFELNLKQAYIVAGEVLPSLRARDGSALCFISSIAALTSMPNKAAYGAAKAGLVSLTRTLAVENAAFGIRVNAVAPGVIATPAIRARDRGAAGGGVDAVLGAVPLGRYGETTEIAGTVSFLLSNLASYVSGQLLTVDGGSSSRYAMPVTNSGMRSAEAMRAHYAMPNEDRQAAVARRSTIGEGSSVSR